MKKSATILVIFWTMSALLAVHGISLSQEQQHPVPPPRHEIRMLLEDLRLHDPAKFEHLMQLHWEDRHAFMQEIIALMKDNPNRESIKFRKEMQELDQKCWKLAMQIQRLPEDADASDLQRQLQEAVAESIELALRGTKQRIEQLQAKIQEIEDDKENILKQRVEFFLSAPPPPNFIEE